MLYKPSVCLSIHFMLSKEKSQVQARFRVSAFQDPCFGKLIQTPARLCGLENIIYATDS
jgi:hypothetical protein